MSLLNYSFKGCVAEEAHLAKVHSAVFPAATSAIHTAFTELTVLQAPRGRLGGCKETCWDEKKESGGGQLCLCCVLSFNMQERLTAHSLCGLVCGHAEQVTCFLDNITQHDVYANGCYAVRLNFKRLESDLSDFPTHRFCWI